MISGAARWRADRWPLLTAVVVAWIEAAALVSFAIGMAVYQLTGHRAFDPPVAWLLCGLAALAGGGLGAAGHALWRGRRYGRSPVVVAQVLAVPIAVDALRHGVWWVGVPLGLVALAGLVGVFAPSTTRTLYG